MPANVLPVVIFVSQKHFNKKYIRYTTRGRGGIPLEEAGLFVSAYQLRDDNSLPATEQQALQQCLRWFERHVRLACLDESSDLDQQARCWYKNPALISAEDQAAEDQATDTSVFSEATAHQALSQTEMLAEMMRRHGFVVHVEQADWPGVIVHGHGIQVTAIPARNVWHSWRLRLQLWWQRHIPTASF